MRMDKIFTGDSLTTLKKLPDGCVQTCVTSPPYFGLRDYGMKGQMGLEETPEAYVQKMVELFREVRRVLRDDGTLWLNLGDSYWGGKGENGSSKARATAKERGYTQSGGTVQMSKRPTDGRHAVIKPKDLIGIPWRVAFALQADGWYLRQDIIWHKPNPMPESVTDRCTKAHEYIFLLSKSPKYYFDHEAVKEPASTPVNDPRNKRTKLNGEDAVASKTRGFDTQCGTPEPGFRNRRSVWTVTTKPYKGAHFATFPPDLIEPCILAGAPEFACSKCGCPHERLTSRGVDNPNVQPSGLDRFANGKAGVHRKVGGQYQKWLDEHPKKTIGYKPTCKCNAPTVGGVVLDPFLGSGTTAAVAKKLGRQYLGCELNPAYVKLAEARLGSLQLQIAV